MDQKEAFKEFEAYLKRRFSGENTTKNYMCDLRQFVKSCQKPWQEITLHDIDKFVDQQHEKGLKPNTINRRVASLRTFFDFLAEESGDLSWKNPVRFNRHSKKRAKTLPRDLNDQVVNQLLNTIHDLRDKAWFLLMLRGGLRLQEVLSLKTVDILAPAQGNQPARIRVQGKGEKERIVLLDANTYAALQEWIIARPPSEYFEIFLNQRNKRPITPSGIQWLLHSYGEKVGVRITPHQLRHTFARQMTEAQMPITSLSKLMGHSQVTTTQIYTAGADPGLCQAYQEAMHTIASGSPTSSVHEPLSHLPDLPEPDSLVHVDIPTPPPLPDWDAWATLLPPHIRKASIDYVKHLATNWKPNTQRNRANGVLSCLKNFWQWQLNHRPIQSPGELSLHDLRAYQSDCLEQGLKNTTVNRRIDYIMGILRRLADQDVPIDHSVFRLHILPRPESLPRHLSQSQSRQLDLLLQSRLSDPDPLVLLENTCFLLLAHTGLRLAECADLLVQDIDLSGCRLFVHQGKGHRDRVVYLSEPLVISLSDYLSSMRLDPSSPLWVKPDYKPVSRDWISDCVTKIGIQAGIPDLTPHRLRHTLATRLLNAGMDITRIQKILGHDLLTTTTIYARVQDATVENDYRKAMQSIQAPLLPASNSLFSFVNVQVTLDNSV